jgi:hypothetical protein
MNPRLRSRFALAFTAIAWAGCECENTTEPGESTNNRTLSFLWVDEDLLRVHLYSADFPGGQVAPQVIINGAQLRFLGRAGDEVIAEIGPEDYGAIGVVFPTVQFAGTVHRWSGTVETTFSKDGLTSQVRFSLQFRGSIPPEGRQLVTSAMRSAKLETWDAGGSNTQVTSRTKTCPASTSVPWVLAGTTLNGPGVWARLDIRDNRVTYFGAARIGSCVQERYNDGTQATIALSWPLVSVVSPNSPGIAVTLLGGTATSSDYRTTWSLFSSQ